MAYFNTKNSAKWPSISNFMGLNPDKSYLDKSEEATKSSAESSFLSVGIDLDFVFIMVYFLLMHKACAYGS